MTKSRLLFEFDYTITNLKKEVDIYMKQLDARLRTL